MKVLALSIGTLLAIANPVLCQELVKGSAAFRYSSAAVSPDNKQIVAIAAKGPNALGDPFYLHYIDRAAGKPRVLLESSDDISGHQVLEAVFSPDGKQIWAGGNHCLYSWTNPNPIEFFARKGSFDPSDRFEVGDFTVPKVGHLVALNFVESHVALVGGKLTRTSTVTLFNFAVYIKQKVTSFTTNDPLVDVVPKLAIAENRKNLVVFNSSTKRLDIFDVSDKQVDVFSATTLKPLSSIELSDYVVKMAFSNDNKKLWILDANRNIQCFDLTPKKISPSAKFHQEEAYWIYPCSKRSVLILASHDGKREATRISFHDLETQKLIHRVDLEAHLRFVTISPDGSLLVGCPTEGGIALWNIDELMKKRK